MKIADDIKQICLEILSKDGIEDGFSVEMSESIALALLQKGYVRIDQVVLDPQKCIQLMANILNAFRADQPFAILTDEEEGKNEAAQDDSPSNSDSATVPVS